MMDLNLNKTINMNDITKKLLGEITDFKADFKGAFNIREDGGCAGRQSSANIRIESKTDKPGIDIRVLSGTKGETVYIPACVTHSDVNDLVYNDFYIGEGADVIVVAGCGVHSEGEEEASHNGIHRFFLEKDSRVKYVEKHLGTGNGNGNRTIDPVTEIFMGENSVLEMDTEQLRGVDRSDRKTTATAAAGAKLIIREKLLTDGEDVADTFFHVDLNGEGASADIVSRAVARGNSRQSYSSTIVGNAPCSGHSECDAIIDGHASVDAAPRMVANHCDAALIHEAAIGKIAGEQILKLRTLGLTEEEAEAKIIEGFLS